MCACLASAWAQAQSKLEITVEAPWVRASLPTQHATGAFMRLLLREGEARLVAASTPLAGATEIHLMSMADNIARMAQVDEVLLVAGKPLELKPGGYHLMLMDLATPLRDGQEVPITLEFVRSDGAREFLEVSAMVRPLNATSGVQHPK